MCRPRAAKTAPRSAARPRAGRATHRGSSPAARAGRIPPRHFAAPFVRATACGTRPPTEAPPVRRFAWVGIYSTNGSSGVRWHSATTALARPPTVDVESSVPRRLPGRVALGLSASALRQLLGQPSAVAGDTLVYHYSRHVIDSKVSGGEYYIDTMLCVVMAHGRVVQIAGWRATTS